MKKLTLWLIKRYLPGHIVIDMDTMEILAGTLDIHILKLLVRRYTPGKYISTKPGPRKAKIKAEEEAIKSEIEEYYEDPQAR